MPGTDPTVPADWFARGDLDLQDDLLTQVYLLYLARSDHESRGLHESRRFVVKDSRNPEIRGQRFA